jgi:hypothetical protein
MTTLLSTVVIAFLAPSVLNAVFSTGAWATESCLARPTGRLPHGNHWHYQTNRITHKRCWVARIGNSIPLGSPADIKPVTPETRAAVLPPAVADANARFEDTFTALRNHATAVTAEVANETPTTSKFESLWIDLSDQAHSSDPQSNPAGRLLIPGDVKKSTKARGHSYTAERWPDVTLMVFLVSLGGALVLYALIGRSFLVTRPAPAIWPDVPSQDDIFRVPSDLDTSAPNLASTAEPADVWPDGTDSRHPGERDLGVSADARLGQIGASQIDGDPSRGRRRASSYQRLANPFAGLGYPDDGESG